MTALARANLFLLVALAIHALDHVLNQPERPYDVAVVVPGALGFVGALLALSLALARRPQAAPLSVLVGFGQVPGFIAIHLLPHWSAFSDFYGDVELNALSWVLLAAPLLAGVLTGVIGLRQSFARAQRRPADVASASLARRS